MNFGLIKLSLNLQKTSLFRFCYETSGFPFYNLNVRYTQKILSNSAILKYLVEGRSHLHVFFTKPISFISLAL